MGSELGCVASRMVFRLVRSEWIGLENEDCRPWKLSCGACRAYQVDSKLFLSIDVLYFFF